MSYKHFLKKILYKVLDVQPFLYRPEIKIYDHRFEIHKTDVDVWPSYPHMHSIEDNLVLDIYSGKVYRKITREHIGYAMEKDMKVLWNDKKFLDLVIEVRKNKPLNVCRLDEIPIKYLDEEKLKVVKENDADFK